MKDKAQEKYASTPKGKDALARAQKKYDEENLEKRREQKREYMRRKRAENPNYCKWKWIKRKRKKKLAQRVAETAVALPKKTVKTERETLLEICRQVLGKITPQLTGLKKNLDFSIASWYTLGFMSDLSSKQIVYSEHHYDECFEYKDGAGRVQDGIAVGYETEDHDLAGPITTLVLFKDIKYSSYDHQYWDNFP